MLNPLTFYDFPPFATPGAGLPATRRIPGETFERLDALRFLFTASAAVANRFVSVDVLNGDQTVAVRIQTPTAVTAGLAIQFNFVRGMELFSSTAGGEQLAPLPDLIFPPGYLIRITAAGIDVADTITAIRPMMTRYPSDLWERSKGAMPYEP